MEINKIFNCLYYLIVISFINITAMSLCCVLNLFDGSVTLDQFSDFISAFVACLAFCVATHEYSLHKDSNQARVLADYNQRYCSDPIIAKVVRYLHENKDNRCSFIKPTSNEVELFMRFIEELEIQIERKRLDEDDVCCLFLYYAHYLGTEEEIRKELGISDYDNPMVWDKFKKVVKRYEKYMKNGQL